MGNVNSCFEAILMIIATLITGFLSYTSPADTKLVEQDYPFILADEVEYSFWESLNCYYVIAGDIEYLDKDTIDHENLVVRVQPLDTYDDRTPATAFIGNDLAFGKNGWSQFLVGNYSYLVWIHDLKLDMPLSSQVIVDNFDLQVSVHKH